MNKSRHWCNQRCWFQIKPLCLINETIHWQREIIHSRQCLCTFLCVKQGYALQCRKDKLMQRCRNAEVKLTVLAQGKAKKQMPAHLDLTRATRRASEQRQPDHSCWTRGTFLPVCGRLLWPQRGRHNSSSVSPDVHPASGQTNKQTNNTVNDYLIIAFSIWPHFSFHVSTERLESHSTKTLLSQLSHSKSSFKSPCFLVRIKFNRTLKMEPRWKMFYVDNAAHIIIIIIVCIWDFWGWRIICVLSEMSERVLNFFWNDKRNRKQTRIGWKDTKEAVTYLQRCSRSPQMHFLSREEASLLSRSHSLLWI